MSEKIRIYVKKVGKEPVVQEVENTLESLQSIVKGNIQPVDVTPNLSLVVNEEGKSSGLPFNFSLNLYDYVAGDAFFVGFSYELGKFVDITDEQIELVCNRFFLFLNEGIQ